MEKERRLDALEAWQERMDHDFERQKETIWKAISELQSWLKYLHPEVMDDEVLADRNKKSMWAYREPAVRKWCELHGCNSEETEIIVEAQRLKCEKEYDQKGDS